MTPLSTFVTAPLSTVVAISFLSPALTSNLLRPFAGMATNVSLELYVASLGSINTENMVSA